TAHRAASVRESPFPDHPSEGRMRLMLAGTVVLAATTALLPAATGADLESKARRLHERAIVVDTHIDAPYALEKKWADVGGRGATEHFDVPRALEGGLT